MLVSKTSDRGSSPRGPAKEHKKDMQEYAGLFCVASKLLCLRSFAGAGAIFMSEAGSRVLSIFH